MSSQGLVVRLALFLLWVPGCGDSGSGPDCDPDPPCDLSGSVEIPVALVIGPGSTSTPHEVVLDTDVGSAAFECMVTVDDGTCAQTERTGLQGWTAELTVAARPDATPVLVLDVDRGEDDSPGPHSFTLEIRSPNGVQVKGFGRSRQVVSANGQTCEQCWYDLPESL